MAAGKHLLLTPGIYHLESALRVSRPGTVVLGLGLPSLIPDKGTPALEIADVDGVKVGGILLEAGAVHSATLLQAGEPGRKVSHAADPTCLYDIFCRAGGNAAGATDCMVTIHSNNVVGDCFWLWRADHGRGVGWNSNKSATGLTVQGDDVTLYGLFVEHCQGYQTVWNGNGGHLYFYQCEMPYDPPSQEAWRHGTVNGYAAYKVGDSVTTHEAWGLGVYSGFRGGGIVADNAIETPQARCEDAPHDHRPAGRQLGSRRRHHSRHQRHRRFSERLGKSDGRVAYKAGADRGGHNHEPVARQGQRPASRQDEHQQQCEENSQQGSRRFCDTFYRQTSGRCTWEPAALR